MATNQYFTDQFVSPLLDESLVEDLVVEAIQVKGLDHYYIPRTLTNFDSFFGEDQASAFNSAIAIEMLLLNVDNWTDDGSFLSKFGLEIRDSAKLSVSIKRFAEEVTSLHPEITRPREGDIISFPSPIDRRMRFFEISYVNEKEMFYQLGKLYTYSITVKNFEYNGEKFNTGNNQLDAYSTDNAIITDIKMDVMGIGNYTIGETVSQISGWSANVVAFNSHVLSVTNVKGELNNADVIIGDTSMTAMHLSTLTVGNHVDGISIEPVNNDAMLNDNTHIDTAVNVGGVVVFSESNPFSE